MASCPCLPDNSASTVAHNTRHRSFLSLRFLFRKDGDSFKSRFADFENAPKFTPSRDPIVISVKKSDLTFRPDYQDIIYFERQHDEFYNAFFPARLEKIQECCHFYSLKFIYLPKFNEDFAAESHEAQVTYENPRVTRSGERVENALSYQDIAEALNVPSTVVDPCLLHCRNIGDDDVTFTAVFLESKDDDSLIRELYRYLNHCSSGPNCLYDSFTEAEVRESLKGKPADERFDEDVFLIAKEIRERVDKLRTKGLTSLAIHKLVEGAQAKPSPMVIDERDHILLPEYADKEIVLSPLHKAVYFLFLKHPEGILFKELPAYRDELAELYGSVTGRGDPSAIEETVGRLTDPMDNSINEKCARIRNVFVSEFREELADWYIIDGPRGERKTIKIPRELVIWKH